MSHFPLAWRLLLRDWRGGELKVLALAIIIAVASIASIGMFTNRIEHAMTDQAGQFLGADMILQSPQPVSEKILTRAKRQSLSVTSMISFSSVVVANDTFQLTHVKAVDQNYPLLSQVKIAIGLAADDKAVSSGPLPGEVWLVPRAFNLLGINVGDEIELGESRLKVTAMLKHDPGRASSFMAIAPRLLMNIIDVEKTNIIQPGSRVTYMAGFAGRLKDRQRFEKWLSPQLTNSQKLIGGSEGSQALNTAMIKAEQYLSLTSMLSVMLAGIAIAMSANRYGQRHFDQSALMRCMGASQQTVIQIFSTQLMIIAALGGAIGCLLGYLTQEVLVIVLKEFLSPDLPAPGFYPVITSFISGFITLAGFSLPALLRLKSVPPLRVLRKDITPLPMSSLLVYGLAISCIILLMWWQSGQLLLTMLIALGVVFSVLVLFILSLLLMFVSRLLLNQTGVIKGALKTGLQQITRHQKENQLQILAFGLSLMILMTIFLLRTDLLARWKEQLPDDAPNHFVINIQSADVDQINQFFYQHKVKAEGLYPMVRGRVTDINDKPVLESVPEKSKLDEALKRELNLSWAFELQKNNKLTAGRWWSPKDLGQPVISIESGLAERLQVGIGDSLRFKIADQSIDATIISLRSVQWDSFQPNFYIVFPDGVINDFPLSYISSFYINKDNKQLINLLVQQFPTVTVLEVDAIMEQVKSMIEQVSLAIEYVMLFVLMAGIMVLVASMQSSMDERVHSAIMMRTLGAKKSYLMNMQRAEYGLLGFFAGVLAVSGTEMIAYLLYTRVFNLVFEWHGWLWLSGPVISVMLILFISRFYTRKVTSQSPLKILRYS